MEGNTNQFAGKTISLSRLLEWVEKQQLMFGNSCYNDLEINKVISFPNNRCPTTRTQRFLETLIISFEICEWSTQRFNMARVNTLKVNVPIGTLHVHFYNFILVWSVNDGEYIRRFPSKERTFEWRILVGCALLMVPPPIKTLTRSQIMYGLAWNRVKIDGLILIIRSVSFKWEWEKSKIQYPLHFVLCARHLKVPDLIRSPFL